MFCVENREWNIFVLGIKKKLPNWSKVGARAGVASFPRAHLRPVRQFLYPRQRYTGRCENDLAARGQACCPGPAAAGCCRSGTPQARPCCSARACPGRSSGRNVSRSESARCAAFVWARRGLTSQKRRLPARAVDERTAALEPLASLTRGDPRAPPQLKYPIKQARHKPELHSRVGPESGSILRLS